MQNKSQAREITIDIQLSRRLAVALVVAFLAIAAAAWLLGDSSPARASDPGTPAAEISTTGMRRFYLTAMPIYDGDDLTSPFACEEGFHVASLWELLDLSNLAYYVGGNSAINPDQGSGPPTARQGWVRTGYVNDTGTTPGQANCYSWTSASPDDNGTRAQIPALWNDPSDQDVHTWQVWVESCDQTTSVWCIED